jgi:hypothetical protein
VNTNVGVGIAQKVATLGKIPIYMPTAAGISWNGDNTGWQWNGGVLAAIHIKNQYYLLPHVRFLKSSVSAAPGISRSSASISAGDNNRILQVRWATYEYGDERRSRRIARARGAAGMPPFVVFRE